MRNKFIFYASYYEMIKDLNQKQKLELLTAIIEYGLYDKEPKLTGALKACFLGIKPNMDNANHRYDVNVANGQKGGNPAFKKNQSNPYYPKDNPEITERYPKDNPEITDTLTDARGQEREKEKEIEKEIEINIEREEERENTKIPP